jgi:transposase
MGRLLKESAVLPRFHTAIGTWRPSRLGCGLVASRRLFVLDGPMDGDAFRAYIEHILVADLTPGDVVMMDNLPAYKVHGVQQAIEAAGAILMYLPAYSPDFNPIEMAFSKFKVLLPAAADCPRLVGSHPHRTRRLHAKRMPKLFRRRRIRCNVIGRGLAIKF